MSEKNQMKELIIFMRDTFTGKIHVDTAVRKFDEFIEATEDFEHENRIYTLEGEIKKLKEKLNETITMLNFVSLYYEAKGDYAGCLLEVK